MVRDHSVLRSQYAKAALVVFLVVTLAVFTWFIPPRAEVLHNILHHLNILPFLLAGMFFGWRGSLKTVLLAVALQSPSIYRHWFSAPVDAQDQIVELSTFGAAGIIAGVLADRERTQRVRVEQTRSELQHVYTELSENVDRLRKTERLTAAGQLSASLAHEIRNPLASISGVAGILARGQTSPEGRAECLDILVKESHRLNKLLTHFLAFARPRLPRFQPTDPADVVRSVVALAQHAASRQGVLLQVELLSPIVDVDCDAEQIKQLLLNLLLNAIEVTSAGGFVSIRLSLASEVLRVEVLDSGPGVPAENRERVFDPFFTTKQDGSGLGLAISASIAVQHGGMIACYPNGNAGSIFCLEIPAQQPPAGTHERLVTA